MELAISHGTRVGPLGRRSCHFDGRNETKLKAAIKRPWTQFLNQAEKRGQEKPTLYKTKYDFNDLDSAKTASSDFTNDLANKGYDGKRHIFANSSAGGTVIKYRNTEQGIEYGFGRNSVTPRYLTDLVAHSYFSKSCYARLAAHLVSRLCRTLLGYDFDPTKYYKSQSPAVFPMASLVRKRRSPQMH